MSGRGVDAIEESSCLLGGEHRRFPFLDDVFGASDRGGRIEGQELAGHQPVEKHLDGGQVLLPGGVGAGMAFDIGGDGHRLDVAEGKATASHQRRNWATAWA